MKLYSDNIDDYLEESTIINFSNSGIGDLAAQLKESATTEIDLINRTYEYVRDSILHSADISGHRVTYIAADVLEYGEGICYAKAHLFAALLRCNGIPAGFCYQKLILDEENAPYIILHGLNGVYISSLEKWIRLDARGNKTGVDAQFSLEEEHLAFKVNKKIGEEDIMTIYPCPDLNVIKVLESTKTVNELWNNLPRELAI